MLPSGTKDAVNAIRVPGHSVGSNEIFWRQHRRLTDRFGTTNANTPAKVRHIPLQQQDIVKTLFLPQAKNHLAIMS